MSAIGSLVTSDEPPNSPFIMLHIHFPYWTGIGSSSPSFYILDGYSPWEPSNLDADARHGFGFASRGLTNDGYAVRTLNLVQNPSVPDDAAAVVVAGPALDLGATDATALNEYLEGGGRMLALLEPDPPSTWRDLIARWGIDVLDGYVIDLDVVPIEVVDK